ncbi:MAG: ATP-binding protein [Terriglobales bacterium]
MRSLFLKIFLWFWLTMVLVGSALVITWSMQPELIVGRWRAATSDAISLYAQTAAEEYDRNGVTGLRNYLQRLDDSTRIRAALLDASGTPIAGSLSPQSRELVEHTKASDQPEFAVTSGTAYAADRSVGPSGNVYVFVAEMQRSPFQRMRLSPRAQALRWTLAIFISGLICYLLTRYLTRPILRLRTASRQLAAGDLSARASQKMERRRDELGDLVRDFNRMAERIELLVNSQRQLISDISHELRSPLARLSVALGLARQRAGQDAAAPLDRIEREAERLNEMIGNLLALARMQAASGPPEKAPVDLRELLAEVAADAGFEAQQQNCTVQLKEECARGGAPTGPRSLVLGSAELLRSAVENVVRNGVRYTAPGTQVDVRLSCVNGWASIQVRDRGPGVPASELANLFRPFYRVANARERQTGGTGLGLAITDRVVRLHGGVVVARNAEGGGLDVEIRLPLANGGAPAAD